MSSIVGERRDRVDSQESVTAVSGRVDGMIARDSQDTDLPVTPDNIKINYIETSTNVRVPKEKL